MTRKLSILAPDWWNFTTIDDEILDDDAALTHDDMLPLSRPGFKVVFYDTLEDFYLAEALEYITAWKQATHDNPVGICDPIGPTEQLHLVGRHPRQPLWQAHDDRQNTPDTAVPMFLLADHPNVQFNFYRHGIGNCDTKMH